MLLQNKQTNKQTNKPQPNPTQTTTTIKTNSGKDHGSILAPKPTSAVEMAANENYLDEPQDTEFKRATIIFIK